MAFAKSHVNPIATTVLAMALVISACTNATPPETEPLRLTARDSADVQILEFSHTLREVARGQVEAVRLAPELSVGGDDDSIGMLVDVTTPGDELLLDGVGRSLTTIEDAWTETQVEYVTAILEDPGQPRSRTATDLGISENSLYKVLRSANFRLYTQQLDTVRDALTLVERR